MLPYSLDIEQVKYWLPFSPGFWTIHYQSSHALCLKMKPTVTRIVIIIMEGRSLPYCNEKESINWFPG